MINLKKIFSNSFPGHRGIKGHRGGSLPSGSGSSSIDSSVIQTITHPTKLREWKKALSALGGSGDKRKSIEKILVKTGKYKYENTINDSVGNTDMFIRGRWNIFVEYNGKRTKVTLEDSYKGV